MSSIRFLIRPCLPFLVLLSGACSDTPADNASGNREAAVDQSQLESMNTRVALLREQVERIKDSNDVKRLQRAFGYYFDKGMWDELADLFSEDASLEYARDGVYEGQERIREYFYALGGGDYGLGNGELNKHFQLMPVITLSEDGETAKGRWRDLILKGQYGEYAWWGEGPFENEYVEEDGVWKISKLHWFQTMMVPYEGGWTENVDVNNGVYVSESLPPDSPPSTDDPSWPETFLPPFHFDNPVADYQAPEIRSPNMETVDLAGDIAMLEAQITQLEDENEIENLQRIFGFYIDKNLWTQAADLFTEDATYEAGGSGVYVGRGNILDYLQRVGYEGPTEGILNEHMQLQPVIHVMGDGTAKGRWHHFSQEAVYGENHFWGTGVYENEYRKEDGVWKISKVHLYSGMRTAYDEGWHQTPLARTVPLNDPAPDLPPSVDYENYPEQFTVPFHYEHPVTGDNHAELKPQSLASGVTQMEEKLDELEHRTGLLQDADDVERLHVIYGYYLARNQWDDLAGIFAEDGSIEIALRGVYRGRESVRRNLDLYGEQNELEGQLHNHMQYQPVIHISEDGQTAHMRSRAFSVMGVYQQGIGRWMGGTYENIFIKRDGVWQFDKDQVFNTYFASFDVGWKDYQWFPAPGITESNPPDEPPTTYFEMYPSPFLPPFHYDNPVTGRQTGYQNPPPPEGWNE